MAYKTDNRKENILCKTDRVLYTVITVKIIRSSIYRTVPFNYRLSHGQLSVECDLHYFLLRIGTKVIAFAIIYYKNRTRSTE